MLQTLAHGEAAILNTIALLSTLTNTRAGRERHAIHFSSLEPQIRLS
jgi:hypothetical protein